MKTYHVKVVWDWQMTGFNLPLPNRLPPGLQGKAYLRVTASEYGYADTLEHCQKWLQDTFPVPGDPLELLAYGDNHPFRLLEREMKTVIWERPPCYASAVQLQLEVQAALSTE